MWPRRRGPRPSPDPGRAWLRRPRSRPARRRRPRPGVLGLPSGSPRDHFRRIQNLVVAGSEPVAVWIATARMRVVPSRARAGLVSVSFTVALSPASTEYADFARSRVAFLPLARSTLPTLRTLSRPSHASVLAHVTVSFRTLFFPTFSTFAAVRSPTTG